MTKYELRLELFRFLSSFGTNIKAKLSNVCAKTGRYNVPSELFQKRTPRSNRCLLQWSTVVNNNLTMDQLNSFEGGVVVEFLNNDYFDPINKTNPIFNQLCKKIGSNDNVSAIISIRSEGGSSSSAKPRAAFAKLINNTEVLFNGLTVTINQSNYKDYAITQLSSGGTGNEKWGGFLFVSIRGGQQDTIETHHNKELTIFNPACEYASQDVRVDIDLVASFFMLMSIKITELTSEQVHTRNRLLSSLDSVLKNIEYDSEAYSGNLYDYCHNHPSIKMINEQLTDPIQIMPINIKNFDEDTRVGDSVDFTHDEAVILDKFYWDKKKKCILSPARPTNIFWSFHLSNMMQQDYSLNSYFEYERKRFELRQKLLKK